MPGTYATISLPVDSLTSTHFRFAELGFLGFLMRTLRMTPFANGFPSRGWRSGRTLWWGPVRCIWFKLAMLRWASDVKAARDQKNIKIRISCGKFLSERHNNCKFNWNDQHSIILAENCQKQWSNMTDFHVKSFSPFLSSLSVRKDRDREQEEQNGSQLHILTTSFLFSCALHWKLLFSIFRVISTMKLRDW